MLFHVTNGESAAGTLRETTLGGDVLPWQDVLHEGPVPAVPRRELLETRARFLSECGWGGVGELHASFERRDGRLRSALRDGLDVVLWFEHDLYDQLQLLDVLALAHGEQVAPSLIVVGAFPGRAAFAGLGELDADELETLWPSRVTTTAEALAVAADVWEAFREPEPTRLATWATRDIDGFPFLAPALRRLLEELPAPTDGLSGTERRALAAVAAGEETPADAFIAAQRLEAAPFSGDTWFYRALSELGRGPRRLVEAADGSTLPLPPPLGDGSRFARLRLRLTATGDRVLRGEEDRVALLGLDRFVGGTHLTADHLWRWDGAEQRLVR